MPDTSPSLTLMQRLGLARTNEEPPPEAANISFRRDVRNELRPRVEDSLPTEQPQVAAPSQGLVSRLINEQPYMGLLHKIFMTQQTDPRVGEALKRLGTEMPEAQKVIATPMSRWENLIRGNQAQAMTDPTGVSYNPKMMQGLNNKDIETMMAHELIHNRQFNKSPLQTSLANTTYNITHSPSDAAFSNPNEQEAYQYELSREHAGKKYLQKAYGKK